MIDITKDIRFGSQLLRIRKQKDGYAGIIVGQSRDQVFATTADEVLDLLIARCGSQTKGFIGLSGARARFLHLFPDAFRDANYIGDARYGERFYKERASTELNRDLPLDSIGATTDGGLVALRIVQRTNLLDRYSKTRLAAVLRSPSATEFLEIVASFARGDTADACRALEDRFHQAQVDSWVCLTYLPFLWRPDRHMFLKPEFTRTFAERIGHRFAQDYSSRVDPDTYASLLHMTETVRAAVADLDPRDNLDIHSFMWATVDYTEADVGPPAT